MKGPLETRTRLGRVPRWGHWRVLGEVSLLARDCRGGGVAASSAVGEIFQPIGCDVSRGTGASHAAANSPSHSGDDIARAFFAAMAERRKTEPASRPDRRQTRHPPAPPVESGFPR